MAKIDLSNINIQPNSNKYKTEREGLKQRGEKDKPKQREKLKPIVGKDAIVSTNKSFARKVLSSFMKKDIVDVKDFLIHEVLIPNVQRFFLDSMAMTFFGERYSSGSRRPYDYSSRYRSSYGSGNDNRDRGGTRYERSYNSDYKNIILRNRKDAEELVDQLCKRIEDNGDVSVAEFLNLLDIPSEYTDNNIGWSDTRDIGIRVVNSGFLIDVAEARYLG